MVSEAQADARYARSLRSIADDLLRYRVERLPGGESTAGARDLRGAYAAVLRARKWTEKGSYVRAANAAESARRYLRHNGQPGALRFDSRITHAEFMWRAQMATSGQRE